MINLWEVHVRNPFLSSCAWGKLPGHSLCLGVPSAFLLWSDDIPDVPCHWRSLPIPISRIQRHQFFAPTSHDKPIEDVEVGKSKIRTSTHPNGAGYPRIHSNFVLISIIFPTCHFRIFGVYCDPIFGQTLLISPISWPLGLTQPPESSKIPSCCRDSASVACSWQPARRHHDDEDGIVYASAGISMDFSDFSELSDLWSVCWI